jgi:hypothetical protein
MQAREPAFGQSGLQHAFVPFDAVPFFPPSAPVAFDLLVAGAEGEQAFFHLRQRHVGRGVGLLAADTLLFERMDAAFGILQPLPQ